MTTIRAAALLAAVALPAAIVSPLVDAVAPDGPASQLAVLGGAGVLGGMLGGGLLLGSRKVAGAGVLLGTAAGVGATLLLRTDDSTQRADALRDARRTVDRTRAMFTRLGFTAADGNAATGLELHFDPGFDNAQFAPGTNGGPDVIAFGSTSWSGVPMSRSADVIAHEYAHRVIGHRITDGSGEARAVNESLADTFASALDDDWTVGEDLEPGGRRDMRTGAGGIADSLGHGGAYELMRVPSRAAAGIGIALGRDVMAQLYADALRQLGPSPTITDLEAAVKGAAAERFGADSPQVRQVDAAWAAARS